MLAAIIAIILIYATDQIVPATSERQAQLRIWLAARATGIAAFLLLTFQVALGLVLSHPTNKSTWKLSKRIFPWHEHLWVFVMAFLLVHIVSIVLDPYAGVGLGGALIPGLSVLPELARRARDDGALRVPASRPSRASLHAAPAGRGCGSRSIAWRSSCGAWRGSTGSSPAPTRDPLRPMYVASGLAVVGGRRLSLLGVPPGPPDVHHQQTGGLPMNIANTSDPPHPDRHRRRRRRC